MMTRYVTGKGASVGIIPPPVVIIVAVGVGDGITEVVLEGGAGRERKGGEREGGRKVRSSGHSSSLVYDYQEVSIRPALAPPPPSAGGPQTNISTPALDGHAAPRVEGRTHVRACVRAQVHVHIFAGSPSIKIQ